MKYTLIFYNRPIFVYVLLLLSLIFVVIVNRNLRLVSRLLLIKFTVSLYFSIQNSVLIQKGIRVC